MRLNDTLTLRTAEAYSNPAAKGDKLPVVLGDFVGDATSAADLAHGGATPAVLIDQANLVYLVNDLPSDPIPPAVYFNGVLQESSVFTYNPDVDYEGIGHRVATIQFTLSAVLSGEVSVRMRGAVDATGTLITNPISGIQWLFTEPGDWLVTDFDVTRCGLARDVAYRVGYSIHWAALDDRTYKQHLADLLYHYHGSHTLTANSTLAISLEEVGHVSSELIYDYLDARRDVDGPDPERLVRWNLDKVNIANTLELSYAYSWVTNDYSQFASRHDVRSVRYYGRAIKRPINLPGVRTLAHLEQWCAVFFDRYALRPAIVGFRLPTWKRFFLQPTTYHLMSWRFGPSVDGRGWGQRILKVLNTGFERDEDGRQVQTLECFDTGLDFREATYLEIEDANGAAYYLRVLPDGTPQVVTFIPASVALLPDAVRWVSRKSPAQVTFYVSVSTAGTLLVDSTSPGGVGTAEPLGFVDSFSGLWELQIINEEGTYRFTKF